MSDFFVHLFNSNERFLGLQACLLMRLDEGSYGYLGFVCSPFDTRVRRAFPEFGRLMGDSSLPNLCP